jgi:hypothetical protein
VHTSTPTNRHRHAKRHAHKHTRACAHATAHADRDFSFVKTDSKVSVDWDSDNDDGAQRAHAQTDMRVCALGFAHRPPSRTRAGARAGWSVDSLDNDSGDELEVTQKVHALMRVRAFASRASLCAPVEACRCAVVSGLRCLVLDVRTVFCYATRVCCRRSEIASPCSRRHVPYPFLR